jgi:hypothetical protein
VFCRIIEKSNAQISSLKKVVDGGSCFPQFGQKADEICTSAIEEFALSAPLPESENDLDNEDGDNEALYDRKVDELEHILDAPLHVLYLKQLTLARERAVRLFRQTLVANAGTSTTENIDASPAASTNEYDAMMYADDAFRKDAEEYTRTNPDWSYSKDAQLLKQSMQDVVSRIKKIQEVKLQAAKQSQQAMSYLQMQQQQLQAIQQQISVSHWC